MDWSNSMSAIIATQQDMHEMVSRFKDMVTNTPMDVTFEFFDNSMYTVPNFAKMACIATRPEITASTTELTWDFQEGAWTTIHTPSNFPIKTNFTGMPDNGCLNGVVIPYYTAEWAQPNNPARVQASINEQTYFTSKSSYPRFGITSFYEDKFTPNATIQTNPLRHRVSEEISIPWGTTCGGHLSVRSRYLTTNKNWTTDFNLSTAIRGQVIGAAKNLNMVGHGLSPIKYFKGDIVTLSDTPTDNNNYYECNSSEGTAFFDTKNEADWTPWGTDYTKHNLVVSLRGFQVLLPWGDNKPPMQGFDKKTTPPYSYDVEKTDNTPQPLLSKMMHSAPAVNLNSDRVLGIARIIGNGDSEYAVMLNNARTPLLPYFENYSILDITLNAPLYVCTYNAIANKGGILESRDLTFDIAVRGIISPYSVGLYEKILNA